MHSAFLFQTRPDLFPHGRMTDLERELWALHYEEQGRRLNRKGKD